MTTQHEPPTDGIGPSRTAESAGSAPSGTTRSGTRRIHARWLARIGGAFACGLGVPFAWGAAFILFPPCHDDSLSCLFQNLQERMIVITVAVLLCGLVAGLVAPTGVAGWFAVVAGVVVGGAGVALWTQSGWEFAGRLVFGVLLLSLPFVVIQAVRIWAWELRDD